MKRKWTRRKFLETSLAGPLVLSGAKSTPVDAATSTLAGMSLTRAEVKILQAAMDEIIPAGDGMPAASEVGGVQYLERVARGNREFLKDLKRSLAHLERISHKRFEKGFSRLSPAERVQALRQFERGSANDFAELRDDVYEAYYTQPQVWKLIGYEFYPTNEAGPQMKPFDESVLATVRKRPKHYREVS
jgi:hypothetical protein